MIYELIETGRASALFAGWQDSVVSLHFKFPIPKFDAGLRIKEAACQLRQAVSFVDV